MEKNKKNLVQAIQQLPEYQPPDLLWQDLAEQLDFDENLESPLREMPDYTPPSALWDELAMKMEQTPELMPKSKFNTLFKWLSAALLLALVFSMVFRMLSPNPAKPVEKQPAIPAVPETTNPLEPIAQTGPGPAQTPHNPTKIKNKTVRPDPAPKRSHRTEVVDDVLILACQQADDTHYSLIETLCQEALPVCEEPQFKKLKTELDELSRAHTELKNALGNFADNPDLVAQLVELERSRNQILQQLITMM